MNGTSGFEVRASIDQVPGDALIVGLSNPGLAGLTAVDHLVAGDGFEQIGHVATENLPDITPFRDGRPRRPVRLYADAESGLTALTSELFVPAWAAEPFVDALVEWCESAGLEDVTVLHGVPYPHGPDQHGVFSVATDERRLQRLSDAGIEPLSGGVFDGVVGELVSRGLDAGPSVEVLVSPTHPPGPDLEVAARLLDALGRVRSLDVDPSELERRSERRKQYYEALEDQLNEISDDDRPADRMFM